MARPQLSLEEQKAILEDVLNDFVLEKLEVIRRHPTKTLFLKPDEGPASVEMVELHYELAMQYFASLELHIPSAKAHQEVLVTLCKRYLLLGSKPKSRDVKDWASKEAGDLRCMLVHALNLCKRASTSRSTKVNFLKRFILDIRIRGGHNPNGCVEDALQAAIANDQEDSGCPTATTTTPVASPAESVPTPTSTSKVVSPDNLETQLDEMLENMNISVEPDAGHADEVMHDDGKRRQAEKDRAPLEADKPQLRPEIEKAAEGCMEGLETTTHENSKDPYTAQLEKSKAAKVLSAEKLLDKAKSDPKVQKKLKEKTGRGRGRGRGRGKAGNVDDQEKSKKADENEHVDGHDEGEQAVEGGPAPSTSEPAPKDESSPDDPAAALATQWAAKEAEIRNAGVPIPEGAGGKKSYSLKPIQGSRPGAASLGILWTLEQIYVTKVLVETAIPNGLQANKKGGCTITVRKRGGWKDSFLMAQKIAGWI